MEKETLKIPTVDAWGTQREIILNLASHRYFKPDLKLWVIEYESSYFLA
jgi:hypothetical protein